MSTDTLNAEQRATLQAAQARRMRLAHYQRQARLVATPDYFTHAEHAARFMVDLRAWCTHGQRRDGCDPYDDRRGMVSL